MFSIDALTYDKLLEQSDFWGRTFSIYPGEFSLSTVAQYVYVYNKYL